MLIASLVANVVLLLFALAMFFLWRAYRRRLYVREGRNTGWPIRTMRLGEFDERFESTEHGPTIDTEVLFVGSGDGVPAGTSDREAWILSVLAKRARRTFEFGTGTGRSTYMVARNAPDQARVTTITLRPDDVSGYQAEAGDSRRAIRKALTESRFHYFLYSGTPAEEKIDQIFADSKNLEEEPYQSSCDLIFVDGSHAYSYIKSDSEKALRMLAPGGVILWHDYRGPVRGRGDVFRYLNELAKERRLVHLADTSFVAYRAEVSPRHSEDREAKAPSGVPRIS